MAVTDERTITINDVSQAAKRLHGSVWHTPLLESGELNERAGRRVLVKAECLQETGSFKIRGAMNRLLAMPASQRKRGVVGFSSGNHGRALASAARVLQCRATIVMPSDAPAAKVAGARSEGAEVILYERGREDREAIAARLVEQDGATLVPPYDDPFVIAGQGTVAWEIVHDLIGLNVAPSHIVIPCSGGGLAAGCAVVVAAHLPATRVAVVEPSSFDDTGRSLRCGSPVCNAMPTGSICDALLVPSPGRLTFPILKQVQALGLAVDDDVALRAMAAALRYLKIVLEPGGAIGLAAVLTGGLPDDGKPVVVVASGGNADPQVLQMALTLDASPHSAGRLVDA